MYRTAFSEAIINWNKRRYGIEINPALLLMSTGVHPSIVSALRAFSPPGSKVLLLTPTYDGFYGDIAAAGCKPEESPLKTGERPLCNGFRGVGAAHRPGHENDNPVQPAEPDGQLLVRSGYDYAG